MNVLSFGEILWDVIEGVPHLGGAPFNFAAHAVQCGDKSFIISRLGKDSYGEKAAEMCKQYGVQDSFIQWDNIHPTGVVDVVLNTGQPDYFIHEHVAYDFIQYEKALDTIGDYGFDVFYFGSLAQRNAVSAETLAKILSRNKFRHVFYDVNLRKSGYTAEIVKRSLGYCTSLKLNTDEVPVLARLLADENLDKESFCQYICEQYKNVNSIIITAADKGCYVFVDNKLVHVPGITVTVEDAVGAGDAFSAAFMHGFVTSNDAVKAAKIANHIGAFVASKRGPLPKYTAEIEQLLKTL